MKSQLLLGFVLISGVVGLKASMAGGPKQTGKTAKNMSNPLVTQAANKVGEKVAAIVKKHKTPVQKVLDNMNANVTYTEKATGVSSVDAINYYNNAYQFATKHAPVIKQVANNVLQNAQYLQQITVQDRAILKSQIMDLIKILKIQLSVTQNPVEKVALVTQALGQALQMVSETLYTQELVNQMPVKNINLAR